MSIIFKVILFVCYVPLTLQTHMPSSYVSFHCIDETERQVAGRCRKQNSVPCCWLQSLYSSQRFCTCEAGFLLHLRRERQGNVKASWYKPTLALKGIFKHIWAWALTERKLRNGSDTMKYECGLLLGKSLANILETVMCTILEEFECVLYKECVRNSPFALLFLFPFAVWWYHRAVFLVLC